MEFKKIDPYFTFAPVRSSGPTGHRCAREGNFRVRHLTISSHRGNLAEKTEPKVNFLTVIAEINPYIFRKI